jgi:thiamine-phosphate pyrophosphorylase
MDAVLLSPVFVSKSASAHPPLGVRAAARMARDANIPVIALGGINAENASKLRGRGFAGLACVDALASA